MFQSSAAGRIASVQSVNISTAEKKKLTSLLSLRSQDPVVVSPHRVVIGWQIFATPTMNTTEDKKERAMTPQMIQRNVLRVPAMRMRVTAMLHLIATAADA